MQRQVALKRALEQEPLSAGRAGVRLGTPFELVLGSEVDLQIRKQLKTFGTKLTAEIRTARC